MMTLIYTRLTAIFHDNMGKPVP